MDTVLTVQTAVRQAVRVTVKVNGVATSKDTIWICTLD